MFKLPGVGEKNREKRDKRDSAGVDCIFVPLVPSYVAPTTMNPPLIIGSMLLPVPSLAGRRCVVDLFQLRSPFGDLRVPSSARSLDPISAPMSLSGGRVKVTGAPIPTM